MTFLELAKARHSVRKYLDRPVEEEKLQRMLEAGRVAPTAANKQPQRFLVITGKDGLTRLAKAGGIHRAPLAVVICAVKDKAWVRPQDGHDMVDIDATIATTHIMLQAWEDGVASCWIDWFDPQVVREEFGLPQNVIPVNILALGYGDGDAKKPDRHAKERMALEDMIWRESYPKTTF